MNLETEIFFDNFYQNEKEIKSTKIECLKIFTEFYEGFNPLENNEYLEVFKIGRLFIGLVNVGSFRSGAINFDSIILDNNILKSIHYKNLDKNLKNKLTKKLIQLGY